MSEPLEVEETGSVPGSQPTPAAVESERIMKLEGRELDVAIRERVFGDYRMRARTVVSLFRLPHFKGGKCGEWKVTTDDLTHHNGIPLYHSSLDAVQPVVRQCVIDCGWDAYVMGLVTAWGWPVSSVAQIINDAKSYGRLAVSSPEQQCRAVLWAYAKKTGDVSHQPSNIGVPTPLPTSKIRKQD